MKKALTARQSVMMAFAILALAIAALKPAARSEVTVSGQATNTVSSSIPLPSTAPSPPASYDLSEVQALRLQVALKDAQIAQLQANAGNTAAQQALQNLYAAADAIIRENHWPADTRFDANRLSFSAPPPKPAAAPVTDAVEQPVAAVPGRRGDKQKPAPETKSAKKKKGKK